MTRDRVLLVLIPIAAFGLVALAVVPASIVPMVGVASFVLAPHFRTSHPTVAAAWATVGVAAILLTAAFGVAVTEGPMSAMNVLMASSLLVHVLATAMFARAAGHGRSHPVATRIAVACLCSVIPLGVIGLGALGRGIALADRGESSPFVEGLLLASGIGVPALLVTGVVAGLMSQRQRSSIAR